MRSRYGYLAAALFAWFLYINGEQYFRFDISGTDVDGGARACANLRNVLIRAGYQAECFEII